MSTSYEITKERTLGDGMDRSELELTTEGLKKEFHFQLPEKPSPIILQSMRPIIPSSKIYKTVPMYIPKEKRTKYLTRKPKEPKFIPYEPYKGAVHPIVMKKKKPLPLPAKVSKNNIEIHHLVTQMSDMRTAELAKDTREEEDIVISKKDWERERKNYENDINNLRESNNVLENQLKLQTQVNSELKTLLVAAVGEDLETRVAHLTEDKLQLARALLKSANHLTTHQEQTEWLSGQCEVWRSKFLASSLMVEELAKWKSALTIRIKELQSLMNSFLEDRRQTNRSLIKTCYNLNEVTKHLDINPNRLKSLKSADVIHLSHVNLEMSQVLFHKFCKYSEEEFGKYYNEMMAVPQTTKNEDHARKVLQDPITISMNHEELCKAVLGEAGTAANDQPFQNYQPHSSCCSHCTGEFKEI
ncbi:golgin-45 [Coccinella septempunctata]|uniref:golgin-45 n=1 Tax=Coccinella septempunctata TaxID=41139 RepID=UPI001D07C0F0|nr:golgin-45 [Coccinella septempunctata]